MSARRQPLRAGATASLAPLLVGGLQLAVLSFEVPRPVLTELTRAERAVLGRLLRGASFRSIAADRGTSPATVGHQVESIYRKLGVHSRSELVALFAGG